MSKLKELVRQMFEVLDTIEMSDNGKEFYPTTISSCREMDRMKLDKVFGEMRKELELPVNRPKLRQRHEIEPGICPRCNGTGDTANHERDSWPCTLCDCSGSVKKCIDCHGVGINDDIDCKRCDGTGLVPDNDW